jgi:hypothetical protein
MQRLQRTAPENFDVEKDVNPHRRVGYGIHGGHDPWIRRHTDAGCKLRKGNTFAKDRKGKSACNGDCTYNWPPPR